MISAFCRCIINIISQDVLCTSVVFTARGSGHSVSISGIRGLHTALQGLLTLRIFVYISPLAVEKQTNNGNKWLWQLLLQIFMFHEQTLRFIAVSLMNSAIMLNSGVSNIVITL